MGIPSNPLKPGTTIEGKISWFGGPADHQDSGHTASGISEGIPGIALYNQATLGGYFLVRTPNGQQQVVRQTDLGPHPSTGRSIDFTYGALPHFGYSQGNFPTDAIGKATYLGQKLPANYQHLVPGAQPRGQAQGQPQQSAQTTQSVTSFDQAGFKQAQNKFVLGQFLRGGSAWDQGGPKGGVKVSDPLLGLLPTSAPNPQDYKTTRMLSMAQSSLQQVAPDAELGHHPAAVNGKVQAMTHLANQLLGKPYVFGGGHGSFGGTGSSGLDCSGFVSAVLHAGGYLSQPVDTTSLPSQPGIQNGPGRYVTIYDRAQPGESGHVIININGQFYEAGGSHGPWGGGGGVMKIGKPSAAYLQSFDRVLHPNGL